MNCRPACQQKNMPQKRKSLQGRQPRPELTEAACQKRKTSSTSLMHVSRGNLHSRSRPSRSKLSWRTLPASFPERGHLHENGPDSGFCWQIRSTRVTMDRKPHREEENLAGAFPFPRPNFWCLYQVPAQCENVRVLDQRAQDMALSRREFRRSVHICRAIVEASATRSQSPPSSSDMIGP